VKLSFFAREIFPLSFLEKGKDSEREGGGNGTLFSREGTSIQGSNWVGKKGGNMLHFLNAGERGKDAGLRI